MTRPRRKPRIPGRGDPPLGPMPDLPEPPRIPLKCLVCGAQFRDAERLDAHVARGHPVTME